MTSADPDLVAAAKFERERRAESYPARIAALASVGEDGPAQTEKLCLDYQCWVAIAEWLETDRFFSFVGGADPERVDAPIVSWPTLEQSAAKAVASVTAKLDALEGDRGATPEALGALRARRSSLAVIHRRIALRRHSIDMINAEARARQQREAA